MSINDKATTRFNSLQTGTRIQSIHDETAGMTDDEFQFPSNGNADPKPDCASVYVPEVSVVSIPFKRERGSKVREKPE